MNFKKDLNDCVENYVDGFLNRLFIDKNIFKSRRNNQTNLTDIDLIISDRHSEYKLDVQYSFDFQKYGDVRIDLMSAGYLKKEYSNISIAQLNSKINSSNKPYQIFESMFDIRKKGKYFTDDQLLGVFYLFYDEKSPPYLSVSNILTFKRKMMFLPYDIVMRELHENRCKKSIKINDKTKNGLIEDHQSAFLAINVADIQSNYNIPLFTTPIEINTQFHSLFEQYFNQKSNLLNSFTI